MPKKQHYDKVISPTLHREEQREYSEAEEMLEIAMSDHPIMDEILGPIEHRPKNKVQMRHFIENLTPDARAACYEEMRHARQRIIEQRKSIYNHIAVNAESNFMSEEELIQRGICPNCKSNLLINRETGEAIRVGCRRYDCPVCGRYRAFRLKKALQTYLKKWKMVRMMTLTYRTTIFRDSLQCANLSSRIYARFTTNLRRHPLASTYERGFQYIRVAEFTPKGFLHYHVLIDRFVRWEVCIESWVRAINSVMGIEGNYIAMSKNTHHTTEEREANKKLYTGSVNFTTNRTCKQMRHDGTMSEKDAAAYVTKYVTKACSEFRTKYGELYQNQAKKFKVWTKSAQIAIFTHKESDGKWEFINLCVFDRTHALNLVTLELSSREDARRFAEKNKLI